MPFQTRLPEALARFGLKVELVPGWQTRGSSSFAPRGAVAHWTAGPRGTKTRPSLNICTNGRAGLPGPLCNVYLDRNGVAVVVAAGRANHAGVGGWKGLTGNSQVFGTEAECGGDGDWTAAQRAAYPRVNAAFCWLGGFGPEMVCGHSEWAPTRKIDIRDWPMSAMRSQVAALLANPAPQEDDMPLNEEDLTRIADRVWTRTAVQGGPWAIHMLAGVDTKTGNIGAWVSQLLARGGQDAAAVAAALKPTILDAVKQGMAADNSDTADQIADRIAAKLASPDPR